MVQCSVHDDEFFTQSIDILKTVSFQLDLIREMVAILRDFVVRWSIVTTSGICFVNNDIMDIAVFFQLQQKPNSSRLILCMNHVLMIFHVDSFSSVCRVIKGLFSCSFLIDFLHKDSSFTFYPRTKRSTVDSVIFDGLCIKATLPDCFFFYHRCVFEAGIVIPLILKFVL